MVVFWNLYECLQFLRYVSLFLDGEKTDHIDGYNWFLWNPWLNIFFLRLLKIVRVNIWNGYCARQFAYRSEGPPQASNGGRSSMDPRID